MGYKQNRRIVRFGATSRGIVLPKGWIEFNELQKGDKVILLGDRVLVIATEGDEAKARRLLEIAEGEPIKGN